jgi:Uma2 family endonuclease
MAVLDEPFRLSYDQWLAMGEAGILPEGREVELLNGIIYSPFSSEPYRLSFEQWLAMGEAGILPEGRYVELLEGILYPVTPDGPAHRVLHGRMIMGLAPALAAEGYTVSPSSVPLSSLGSEPYPDLTVLAPDYDPRDPLPSALLVVEVSDSSRRKDLTVKRSLYARAGIPEYWIVLVRDREVVRLTEPQPDGEWGREERLSGGVLRAVSVPEAAVDLDALLADLPD